MVWIFEDTTPEIVDKNCSVKKNICITVTDSYRFRYRPFTVHGYAYRLLWYTHAHRFLRIFQSIPIASRRISGYQCVVDQGLAHVLFASRGLAAKLVPSLLRQVAVPVAAGVLLAKALCRAC